MLRLVVFYPVYTNHYGLSQHTEFVGEPSKKKFTSYFLIKWFITINKYTAL